MTIDEELNLLDEQLRRPKIEYEIFFNNPAKRPPTDVEWKVLSLIRKFSDGKRMSFPQRFRYNEMAQRYAVQSDLWRKKMRIREEGCRRPQDALLSVQGTRTGQERTVRRQVYGLAGPAQPADSGTLVELDQPFSIQCSGASDELKQVEALYMALTEAKKRSGEEVSGNFDLFATFVMRKTNEIREQQGCAAVVYSVEMQDGQVKLKARAKT